MVCLKAFCVDVESEGRHKMGFLFKKCHRFKLLFEHDLLGIDFTENSFSNDTKIDVIDVVKINLWKNISGWCEK